MLTAVRACYRTAFTARTIAVGGFPTRVSIVHSNVGSLDRTGGDDRDAMSGSVEILIYGLDIRNDAVRNRAHRPAGTDISHGKFRLGYLSSNSAPAEGAECLGREFKWNFSGQFCERTPRSPRFAL